MYAIFNKYSTCFKTYDGWTQYIKDEKGERIEGTQDILRFTRREAELNSNRLPPSQIFVPYVGPISWKEIKR